MIGPHMFNSHSPTISPSLICLVSKVLKTTGLYLCEAGLAPAAYPPLLWHPTVREREPALGITSWKSHPITVLASLLWGQPTPGMNWVLLLNYVT